ncbi:MAG: hypothetical protein IPL41_08155 [Micropruina sp.]|nr:hypothetical protein [Micropruina sp.]
MPNEEVDAKLASNFARAIDFKAIGETVSELGGTLYDDDGWIRWCGSDFRLFKWRGFDLHDDLIKELTVNLRELNTKLGAGRIG